MCRTGSKSDDADRHRQRDLAVAEADRRRHHPLERSDEAFELGVDVVEQDDDAELVAADARQRVARLEFAAEPTRHGEQRRIAERHAERVVDLLEAVDVDRQRRRGRRAGPLGLDDRRPQPVEEQFAIGQAGEIVVDRVVKDALFRGLDLGDVGQRADDPDHLAGGVDAPGAP